MYHRKDTKGNNLTSRKKIYVLDTSVYLTSANSLYSYGTNDILVPLKVLEELDKHKNRQDMVGQQARLIIKRFDELREKKKGAREVRIAKRKGMLRFEGINNSKKYDLLPRDLDDKVPDNQIMATALLEKHRNPDRKVVLVSRDVNMRTVGGSIGLDVEGYNIAQVVVDREKLYSGTTEILVDEEYIDRLHESGTISTDFLEDGEVSKLFPNQFVMLKSNLNEKNTTLSRFLSGTKEFKKVNSKKVYVHGGVKAKNKEQSYALDLLLDPEVPIVTLIGKAGSGKTLLALAAGLSQVLEGPEYSRLLVSRPVQPLGKDIGFLPGTLEEKMLPWLAPIQDNLQYLMKSNRAELEEHMASGVIEVEALTYIRGRSISDAFVIIDEAQNLSIHELKTIITRVGEGTKIILTGDIEQIDNVYVNDTSNGLAYAVEKFKAVDLAGHVTLLKGERSPVATMAAKVL